MATYLDLALETSAEAPAHPELAWIAKVACVAPVQEPWVVVAPDGTAAGDESDVHFAHTGSHLTLSRHPLDTFFEELVLWQTQVCTKSQQLHVCDPPRAPIDTGCTMPTCAGFTTAECDHRGRHWHKRCSSHASARTHFTRGLWRDQRRRPS